MIPQMLSSPPAATARTAPPQGDTAGDPRKGDAAAPEFTLGTENAARDLSGGSDATDAFAFAADAAKAPVPLGAGALAPDGTPADARRRQDSPPDTARPLAFSTQDLAVGQPERLAKVAGHAAAQVQPPGPAADVAHDADGTRPQIIPGDAADAKTEPRNAAPTAPPAIAPATAGAPPDRINRLPSARSTQPAATGATLKTDGLTAEGSGPITAGPSAANPGGTGAPLPATTAATDPTAPPTEQIASVEDTVAAPREMDMARTETGRTDPLRAEPAARTELARTVGNQLVEAVRHGANGSTDVSLNPEELGRVRLSLTAQDGVLHVSVLAERPETHDLLRRNIGLLQSDFRALGYADVAFDFGSGGQRADRPADSAPDSPSLEPAADSPTATVTATAETPRTIAATGRLDLRL